MAGKKAIRRYLEKRDPKAGQMRFYVLWIVPGVFEEWGLVREWGRIGSPGRVVTDWFATFEEAEEALAIKQGQKIRRGYRVRTIKRSKHGF